MEQLKQIQQITKAYKLKLITKQEKQTLIKKAKQTKKN